MDMIVKAIADPARRQCLDRFPSKHGQTLSELQAGFDMTPFGVMKHPGVLEDAGLIASKKQGRFKYHYRNAVPLREAMDRWIEPLIAKPLARRMIALKTHFGMETDMFASELKPDFAHQTLIRCTQDALWDARMPAAGMITCARTARLCCGKGLRR